MKEIIIATKNKGKARDFEGMFQPMGYEVKTLLDFDELEDVEETGETFEENAILKAETIAKRLGRTVIADDSGLIVEALNGEPGVYSARYAGEQKDDEANIDKVLKGLEGVPELNRTARFYCALAIAFPERETITVGGTCEGSVLHERRGTYGFGYDPIFLVKDLEKSMAELTPEEKNQISHRAAALNELRKRISSILETGEK